MAFKKKTWKDRITEFPTRRTLNKSDGSSEIVTVARAEGTVSQEGDAFNAANMNDLENRIDQANNDLSKLINSGLSNFGRVTKILDHVAISTSSKQFTLGDLSKYKFLFFESSTLNNSTCLTSNLIPKEIYLMGKLISNIFFNDPSSYAQIRYQCVHATKINAYIDIAAGFSTLGFSVYGIE